MEICDVCEGVGGTHKVGCTKILDPSVFPYPDEVDGGEVKKVLKFYKDLTPKEAQAIIDKGGLELEQVDSFEKKDGFSDYWDQFIKDPIQATYWGVDPNGGVHSFLHEGDAVECATQTDILVFKADLAPAEESW